jgi:hypothetical protein
MSVGCRVYFNVCGVRLHSMLGVLSFDVTLFVRLYPSMKDKAGTWFPLLKKYT